MGRAADGAAERLNFEAGLANQGAPDSPLGCGSRNQNNKNISLGIYFGKCRRFLRCKSDDIIF
jgi:hypothetical protein